MDDKRTIRFVIRSFHASVADQARRAAQGHDHDYNPADHYENLFGARNLSDVDDLQFAAAQDYVALRGQGPIADRQTENLSVSDAGIVFVRKIFLRELEAIRQGGPTKKWLMLENKVDMPIPSHEVAT